MKVLAADKDTVILSLVSTRLTARGYEVVEFSDKETMLRYLGRETVDLILLSTTMDRMGGILLVEKIRHTPHLATIPIVMMADEDSLAELMMAREHGFDDFLIKPFNAFVLQLRVDINISRNRARIEANALTHLPGNHSIERTVQAKIQSGEKFSVLYIDIGHFKSFNDVYGFDRGDDVIRHTARLMLETARQLIPEGEYFVGHVGGDDFVVILNPEYEKSYANSFIAEFDRIIGAYYNDEDRKRGFLRVTNRRGKRENLPLMSCSVAACNNLHRKYTSLREIAQDASELKAFLKSQSGSHYLRDRRSEPIPNMEAAVQILAPQNDKKKPQGSSEPLGKILLEAGLINEQQLSNALKRQFKTGQRLGQILIAAGAVKSDDVGSVLQKKLRVPYVSLTRYKPDRQALKVFTADFMRSAHVVPLSMQSGKIKLAMCDPFDLKVMADVERITGYKPVPSIALEDEFEKFMERYGNEFWPEENAG
ncbi:MAG: response regulator [Candidatus Omnitrophota bacterium]|nr:response regulator [Candidatus Omnitrophota bacterium]